MKSKSRISFIVTILACIAMLAGYVAFYLFLNKEISQTVENEGKILLLQAKDAEINTQKKLIDETKEKREELEQYFVSDGDIPLFLERIENFDQITNTTTLIQSVGVKDVESRPAPKKSEGSKAAESEPEKEASTAKPTLVVSLESEGTFAAVYQFLQLVESMPYEIQVESVTLARTSFAPEAGGLPTWKLTTTFEVISFIPS